MRRHEPFTNVNTTTTTTTTPSEEVSENLLQELNQIRRNGEVDDFVNRHLNNIPREIPNNNNNPEADTNIVDPLQRDLEELAARATERAAEHHNDVDAYLQIADRMRELRNETLHLLNTMGNWAYNHPWIAAGTLTAITGVGIFMIRGYRAIGFVSAAAQGGGLFQNIVETMGNPSGRSNNPQSIIARRDLVRTLNDIGRTGGIFFIIITVIRGLQRF